MAELYEKFKVFLKSHERSISVAAFVVGFIGDALTLRRIDLWIENIVILFYLALAVIGITALQAYESGKIKGKVLERISHAALVFLPFAFGALFSAFVVLYTKSASLFTSAPFLITLAAFFIGNEFFRKRYQQFAFRLSVFFIALFSYAIMVMPLLINRIGPDVFLVSGLVSLLLMTLVMVLLSLILPERIHQSRKALLFSFVIIYAAFHIFYFTGAIPPVPLSLKEGGIYHRVERTAAGDYLTSFEPAPWYLFLETTSRTYHRAAHEPVYAYSAVFTPAQLGVNILHRWAYYDVSERKWIETNRIKFPIVGGRDGGYRGYTLKESVFPGKWRVDVITESGQVLGRMTFNIVDAPVPPNLESSIR